MLAVAMCARFGLSGIASATDMKSLLLRGFHTEILAAGETYLAVRVKDDASATLPGITA